jgi:adenine-specific DNA-methyltransferase
MVAFKQYIPNNAIETAYSKSISLEHRKKFAQFFTPFPIASLMASWVLGNEQLKTVLEPAFGLGVFSRALLSQKPTIEIKGFEVDKTIFEYAKQGWDIKNITLVLQDYMCHDWNNKYDGILCNPPYFKFHDYDNKTLIKTIETNLKCKLNGFTNLYTLFLLKSIHQLNPNGRCAYIIPSEFLNSDYGKFVKAYLLKSKTLKHIIVIDFEANVFEDALTTASILLCAQDALTDQVQFSNVQSLQDLNLIEQQIKDYPNFSKTVQTYDYTTLDPNIKWKAYYQKQNRLKFKNLVPFSTYAKVVRGIATGCNEYFTFNGSKAKQYAIQEQYLLPCICRAMDVKKSFFTQSDFEDLKARDKSIFLLNTQNTQSDNVHQYILKGESEGIDKKFLTANRTPWYALENRPPAPIWVSVFNRNGLRFIRNEANISNLTTYHCIYPKETTLFAEINIDLLFAYLLTTTAKQIFEDNCREYGNGLQKFEPNDLNKGMMLDLGLLSEASKHQILTLFQQYKDLERKNESGDAIINEIDKILVKNFIEP